MERNLSSKRYEPLSIDLENNHLSQTLIINHVGYNKNVLEIGTSTGYVSKILKERQNVVTGIELDREAGLIAEQYCDQMIIGDIEKIDLKKYLEPESFDVIICGDVLEHLKNPSNTLKKVKKYIKSGGYLVVSLPNFCHGDVFLNLFYGDFHYTPTGLLDETHLRFFGLKNIYSLFAACGYQISDIRTINMEVGTTELKIDEKKIPESLLIFIRSLPNSNVFQYIFTAYPSENVINPEYKDLDLNTIVFDTIEESNQLIRSSISDRESQIVKLNDDIIVKENQISLISSMLEQKNQELNEHIRISELKNQELNEHIRISELKNQELNEHIRILEQKIIDIENSILWKLKMKFQNIFESIIQ